MGISTAAIQEAVVAFSNASGGMLMLGVENDGTVVGRELTQAANEQIQNAVMACRNPGRYLVQELLVGKKSIIMISVQQRTEGVSQTPDGRPLIRRGPTNQALFDAELRQLMSERSLDNYEEADSGMPLSAADAAALEELRELFGWTEDPIERRRRLQEQGLAIETPSGTNLTIAGALYLLASPDARLGKAYVEVLRFPDEGVDYDKRTAFVGPLQAQVRDVVAEILSELGSELVVVGVRRYELPRLPEVVLREAIANAVAHRSYELSGACIRVEIRPASVAILSPGGLPEPVTEQNIREAQSARNLNVIKVLRRFNLAEDAGRGVDVMQDTMTAEMLDAPAFRDHGHQFEVMLPVRSTVSASERAWVRELEHRGVIEVDDRILLVHAARGAILTNARARELLNADSVKARQTLQRLRDAGLLKQSGTRGGARYRLTSELAPPVGLRLEEEELVEVVFEMAFNRDYITNADVRRHTSLDRVAALRVLDMLVSRGWLEREGAKRGVRYRIPFEELEDEEALDYDQ